MLTKVVLPVVILFAVLMQAQNNQASTPGSPQASPNQPVSQSGIDRIVKEVHHELVLLPYYGVFDNLAYRVSPDGTVSLLGQVARPSLKSDAESAVKHIEGVERVDTKSKCCRRRLWTIRFVSQLIAPSMGTAF